MAQDSQRLVITASVNRLFLISVYLVVFFFFVPLLIYFLERGAGVLPAFEVWQRTGNNHGPWRDGLEGTLLWMPAYLLPFITSALTAGASIYLRSPVLLIRGTLLSILQFVILLVPLFLIGWTVD